MTATATTVSVRHLALADLVVSPHNARRPHADDPKVLELSKSIAAVGVQVPVAARPHPSDAGKWELLYGSRRLLASALAKMPTIPCLVYADLDDAEAYDLTFHENTDRDDLSPVEQGRAVATLLEHVGGDIGEAAAKLGQSRQWVLLRIRLSDLSEDWQEAIATVGTPVSRLSIGHLVLIARLHPEVQDQLLDGHCSYPRWWDEISVDALDQCLNNQWLRQLSKAGWKLDDATLVPEAGPCTQCIKRSSRQRELFADTLPDGDDTIKADRCLDVRCWQRKLAAGIKSKAAALKKQHGQVVLVEGSYEDERGGPSKDDLAAAGLKGIKRDYDFAHAKKGDKGAVCALVATGSKAGSTRWVKPYNTGGSQSSGSGNTPPTLAEQHEELTDRRHAAAAEKAMAVIREAPAPAPRVIAALAATFGTAYCSETAEARRGVDDWDAFANTMKADCVEDILTAMWLEVREGLEEEQEHGVGKRWPWMVGACVALGIDPEPFLTAATAEIPEPPEWAALEADAAKKAKAPAKKPAKGKKPAKKKASKAGAGV